MDPVPAELRHVVDIRRKQHDGAQLAQRGFGRYWAAWADWLRVPRHTLSALVGAVVVDGRDNADTIRLLRPNIDISAEYAARDAAGLGERLDESDLYEDVRPAAGRSPRRRGTRHRRGQPESTSR